MPHELITHPLSYEEAAEALAELQATFEGHRSDFGAVAFYSSWVWPKKEPKNAAVK